MTDPLRELALSDPRYALEAYQFLFEALDLAVRSTGRAGEEGSGRHVSGQELLQAMKEHARNLFGPLAAQVWRSWGVHEPLDWGRIVFRLVDARMLNQRKTDSIDDFREDLDLDAEFVHSYRPSLPPEIGPAGAED